MLLIKISDLQSSALKDKGNWEVSNLIDEDSCSKHYIDLDLRFLYSLNTEMIQ